MLLDDEDVRRRVSLVPNLEAMLRGFWVEGSSLSEASDVLEMWRSRGVLCCDCFSSAR